MKPFAPVKLAAPRERETRHLVAAEDAHAVVEVGVQRVGPEDVRLALVRVEAEVVELRAHERAAQALPGCEYRGLRERFVRLDLVLVAAAAERIVEPVHGFVPRQIDTAVVAAPGYAVHGDGRKLDAHVAVETGRTGAEVGEERRSHRLGVERHAAVGRYTELHRIGVHRADRVPEHVHLAVRADDGPRALHEAVIERDVHLEIRTPRRTPVDGATEVDLVTTQVELGVRHVDVAVRGIRDHPGLVEEEAEVALGADDHGRIPVERGARERAANDRHAVRVRRRAAEPEVVELAGLLVHAHQRIAGPDERRESRRLRQLAAVGERGAAVGAVAVTLRVAGAVAESLAVVPRHEDVVAVCRDVLLALAGRHAVSGARVRDDVRRRYERSADRCRSRDAQLVADHALRSLCAVGFTPVVGRFLADHPLGNYVPLRRFVLPAGLLHLLAQLLGVLGHADELGARLLHQQFLLLALDQRCGFFGNRSLGSGRNRYGYGKARRHQQQREQAQSRLGHEGSSLPGRHDPSWIAFIVVIGRARWPHD